ncbi:MAG: tetratricopeptide repeat protein, partial [Candidatus Margulisbacteria bacterium]|nr:tetratricopeptide repeat protein [Candidatus Margulisiibacteriota bacterium]
LLAMQEKKYDEAEMFLNKALYLNQKLGVLFANMGLLWQLKGDLNKAEKNYNEALALDENLHSMQINLGDLLYQQKRITDAMVYWQRALELSPIPELAQRRLMWKVI